MRAEINHGSFEPCPDPFNLAEYVLRAGQATPEKPAIEVWTSNHQQIITYAELTARVCGLASDLKEQGIRPGDRILLRVGNEVAFPISFLAVAAIGALPVPTSAHLTVAEITKMADIVEPAAIIAGAGVALPEGAIPIIRAETVSPVPATPLRYHMGDPNRPGYIMFTSGTSSQPRAVLHAHRAIWARRMMWPDWYGLTPTDRMMHAGAFNWTYTLGTGLLDPWAIGATAIVAASGTAVATLPHLINQARPSIFAAAPGIYRNILKSQSDPVFPTLRHGLSAGEKLSDQLRSDWQNATGLRLLEAYGMTECSTFLSDPPNQPDQYLRPQNGRRIAITKDGKLMDRGNLGTISIHKSDPGLMLGYITPNGIDLPLKGEWFETGDAGKIGQEDQVNFLSRNQDLLNAGGFRTSPLEIETVLSSVEALEEIAVFQWETPSGATIILAAYCSNEPIAFEEFDEIARSKLAQYKQPKGYFRLQTLPRNANGKLNRAALPALYEDQNGQT